MILDTVIAARRDPAGGSLTTGSLPPFSQMVRDVQDKLRQLRRTADDRQWRLLAEPWVTGAMPQVAASSRHVDALVGDMPAATVTPQTAAPATAATDTTAAHDLNKWHEIVSPPLAMIVVKRRMAMSPLRGLLLESLMR